MIILPLAMSIGVVGAILRSLYNRQPPVIPDLKLVWLVLVGIILQYLIFAVPSVNQRLSLGSIGLLFVGSLLLLTIFAWFNRSEAGFWLLGVGLFCNLIVIASNGGLMPISPATIAQLNLPQDYIDSHVQIGQPFANSKDIVLLQAETWFWWLSDTFVLPAKWLWWRTTGIAFSLGDVLIALGAIRFFWASGATEQSRYKSERLDINSYTDEFG